MNVFQDELFQLLGSQVAVYLWQRWNYLIEGRVCIVYVKVFLPVKLYK